ncbi:hypothetical protein EZV62_004215 [Acer yangbiense]|uniref:Uncharacterized protein n=1 Tax=Acer yangbiense TaxID=1000413 RepID=A0A5C7IJ31_9ROSI|nr:hypothetical protein EZV62_004215 [Acer yangbiense]
MIELSFSVLDEKQVIISLEAILEALMASKSISELETSRASFSSILGPRIADLISTDSQSLTAMSAEAITNIFSKGDYCRYFPSLETTGAVDKLAGLLQNCDDPIIQINIFAVLSKLAEFGSPETVDKVLQSIRFDQLAELLSRLRRTLSNFSRRDLNKASIGNVCIVRPNCSPFTEGPKPQTFEDVIHRVLDGGNKQVLEAMQDLIPFLEKADDPRIREMILKGLLICGEPCIKKYLEYDIIPLLVKMMQCGVAELQDSAYTALHQMLFSNGGGGEACEIRKNKRGFRTSGETLTEFLKGMDKCKHLSIAERKSMKQQVVRKVRAALKGHKFETKIYGHKWP